MKYLRMTVKGEIKEYQQKKKEIEKNDTERRKY